MCLRFRLLDACHPNGGSVVTVRSIVTEIASGMNALDGHFIRHRHIRDDGVFPRQQSGDVQ